MKKIIIPIVAALSFCTSSAQSSVVNNPDNKAYFGIRVAGEVTCPGDVKAEGIGLGVYTNGGGVEFGGIYNIPVVANFYVEPGLKFYYNAYSLDKKFLVGELSEVTGASVRKFGMRVPVMLGYHFDFTKDLRLRVFTGPELEVGFTSKMHVSVGDESGSESLYGEGGGMNRVDALWGFGAGIDYSNFYFGVSGSVGMCNMLSDSDGVKFHENRVSFTLGYNF